MKPKHIEYYMRVCYLTAKLSTAKRLKVGAIAVKDNRTISIGYNGTVSGQDNSCEYIVRGEVGCDPEEFPLIDSRSRYKLVTKPEVIHAERNCLDKIAKSNESSEGAVMFITHSPCIECAKSIFNTGIKTVFYSEFKTGDGIDFLTRVGVAVIQYEIEP